MATWTTAFVNDLPDSSFLYIEPGGTKDSGGKTTPRSLRHFPVKDASGAVDMPHLRNALARIPQSSLPQSVKDSCTAKAQAMMKAQSGRAADELPTDDLFRACYPGVELRQEGEPGQPTLFGHLAVFNQWTEINSVFEGHFLERLAPGAFTKTFRENRDKMRVLFQHGKDPQIGDKPLGPIERLGEDETGAFYEVPMLDTSYNRDLIPGLQAGLYGSSFRFKVMKDEVDRRPSRSAYNPKGLPERTITEVRVPEFGPVTFPAYEGATAGVRSITDRFVFGSEFREATEDDDEITPEEGEGDGAPTPDEDDGALSGDGAEGTHSDAESRDDGNPAAEEALDTDGADGSHSDQPSRTSYAGLPKPRRSRYSLEKQKEGKPSWLP